MMLTDSANIKVITIFFNYLMMNNFSLNIFVFFQEVLLFPAVKPYKEGEEKSET
jgi:hypothetical protein